MASTSPLLQLPMELRDKILKLLITSHTTPPKDASDAEVRTVLQDISLDSWCGGSDVMHVQHLNRADFIPTLLVNHQLQAETLAAIELLPNNYIMHAMLVNESQLWPTWVSVPSLASQIERLHFSVVSVGARRGGRSGWRPGDGSPPPITWYFYGLLERVLKVGPRLGHQRKVPTAISIKHLDIEILSPDVPAEQLAPENAYPDHRRDREASIRRVIHPKRLLHFLWDFLGHLLSMSYHTADYGAILYERIGGIRMILDGMVVHEVDLGERLQLCRFNDSFGRQPRDERLPRFKEWKAKAFKKRVELGFPVMPEDSVIAQVREEL